MSKWIKVLVGVALFASATTGCCKKDDKGEQKQKTTTEVSSDKGLNNPANDKAVVAAAKTVVACPKWMSHGPSSSCEAYKSWNTNPLLKGGKADATMINFLEDPSPKVRWIGARTLRNKGIAYRTDKTMAKKVLDALLKEKDPMVLDALSAAVGNMRLVTVGLNERIKELLSSSPNEKLRVELASDVLFSNRDAPGMYDLFVKLSRSDKNPKVRLKASTAFWTGTPRGKDEEVCKLWLDLAKSDPDKDVAGHSAYHCAFSTRACTGQWDGLLTAIENKAKSGKVRSNFTGVSLGYLYDQKKASSAQKQRALAVAKVLVANPANDGMARSSALRFIGKKDPGGKAFAGKYLNDSAFFVKTEAKRIVEGK